MEVKTLELLFSNVLIIQKCLLHDCEKTIEKRGVLCPRLKIFFDLTRGLGKLGLLTGLCFSCYRTLNGLQIHVALCLFFFFKAGQGVIHLLEMLLQCYVNRFHRYAQKQKGRQENITCFSVLAGTAVGKNILEMIKNPLKF